MNYEAFEDNGAHAALYFILDQSRREPPLRRAHLMLSAAGLLPSESPARAELYYLGNELCDCQQAAAKLIGTIRSENAEYISKDQALSFLLRRLEDSPLSEQFDLTGHARNMGLSYTNDTEQCRAWVKAYERHKRFEGRLDLFMFHLRTRYWEGSNADALADLKTADAREDAERRSRSAA